MCRAGYLPPCALILDILLINTEAGNEWGFLLHFSTVVSDNCRTAEPLHSSSFQVEKKKKKAAESVFLIFMLYPLNSFFRGLKCCIKARENVDVSVHFSFKPICLRDKFAVVCMA